MSLVRKFFHHTGPGVAYTTVKESYRGVCVKMNQIILGERKGITLPKDSRLTRSAIEDHVNSIKRIGESITTDKKFAEGTAGKYGTVIILKPLVAVNVQESIGFGDKGEYLVREINIEDILGFLDVESGQVFPVSCYQPPVINDNDNNDDDRAYSFSN